MHSNVCYLKHMNPCYCKGKFFHVYKHILLFKIRSDILIFILIMTKYKSSPKTITVCLTWFYLRQ